MENKDGLKKQVEELSGALRKTYEVLMFARSVCVRAHGYIGLDEENFETKKMLTRLAQVTILVAEYVPDIESVILNLGEEYSYDRAITEMERIAVVDYGLELPLPEKCACCSMATMRMLERRNGEGIKGHDILYCPSCSSHYDINTEEWYEKKNINRKGK